MVFRNIVLSHLSALSLQQALNLSNIYLENAYTTADRDIALVLCHETKVALSQAKSADRKYPAHPKDTGYQSLRDGVATAYIDLGKLLEKQGYQDEAQAIYKKAEKWGGSSQDLGRFARSSNLGGAVQKVQSTSTAVGDSQVVGSMHDVAKVPAHIFPGDIPLPTIDYKLLPEPEGRLNSTRQLVCCLGLLQDYRSTDDALDVSARNWLQAIEKDADEQERLHAMATEVIRAFKRNEIKDAKAVAEVVCLAPVLNKDSFHDLLSEFYSGVDHSGLLNFYQLEGLAHLIQDADPGHLSADDLVKILELVSTRLRNTHQQSTHHMHRLTLAVSHVLDAMAETKVTGLDREKLHEPLSTYLDELRRSKDTYLVYQASYAYQALLCVPDDETTWQAAMRRTGKVVQGVSGLVSAAKNLDLVKFVEGLQNIQKGFAGASKVVGVIKTAYDGVTSLVQSGEGFKDCLHEGLSFKRKRAWYSALRGADIMIRNGELAMFRKLVCGAPCRYDVAFQWGVCHRLGGIAANPMWDLDSRRGAVAFLGEIYKDDDVWGKHARIKQWILNILMQLATSTTGVSQCKWS
ncbi:hypothetical protein BGX34_011945 [Mortierella sp. NVP85]|nr:hypothetical protein BGX34_011945 [Mortierella sp. NVP85]